MSQTPAQTAKGYLAGVAAYSYPRLGEAKPPGGDKVLLLTIGGICVSGTWSDDGRYLAWSPLPRRGDYHYPGNDADTPPSGQLLLLSCGGICIFGPWSKTARYQGWARLPTRDRAKEAALSAMPVREWRMAA